MVVRLYAVACLALGCLLLGGSGIALAGDDSYGGGQSGGYSTPDAAAHPDAPGDEAAPAQPDDAGPGPDDHGGDDVPPPQPDQPD